MRAAHVRAIAGTAPPRVSGHTQDRALHLVNMKTTNHGELGGGTNVGTKTHARQGKVKLLELGAQLSKGSVVGGCGINMYLHGIRVDRFILP